MLLMERSALTISGSIRLRDFCAFFIQRGGMFARNLKNPRTAEPELDKRAWLPLALRSPPHSKYVLGKSTALIKEVTLREHKERK
jgi:hypothetical protein